MSDGLRWVDLGAAAPAADRLETLSSTLGPLAGDATRTVRHLGSVTAALHDPAAPGLRDAWSALATVGAYDLTVARVLEPHIDALEILDEAGSPLRDGAGDHAWGVFAAEGSGVRLTATEGPDGWTLRGDKPWCSLARHLDRALVTAWTGTTTRRLFAVDLSGPTVAAGDDPWVARGLTTIDSPSLAFRDTPAAPVGADAWYLTRPGFARGGVRVAAVWHGAAVEVGRTVLAAANERSLDQVGKMHLGAIDAALHRARCVLVDAADQLSRQATPRRASVVALHARNAVRTAAEEVLQRAAHALGPAPLVRDESHARRVADLGVYLRQEHAERDEAALGGAVAEGDGLVL